MNRLELVLRDAQALYDNGDPSHDFQHVKRVVSTARRIGEAENANLTLLLPAAVLHDIVNLPKNHPERGVASKMAAKKASVILRASGFNQNEIDQISEIIVEHSYSRGQKPSTIESAILQDADRVDALGAIGILRTTTCGARMGASYYHGNEPFPQTRELNDKAYTLDHFYAKLLKLPEAMNTQAGRAEAETRVQFMRTFLAQLKLEIA